MKPGSVTALISGLTMLPPTLLASTIAVIAIRWSPYVWTGDSGLAGTCPPGTSMPSSVALDAMPKAASSPTVPSILSDSLPLEWAAPVIRPPGPERAASPQGL